MTVDLNTLRAESHHEIGEILAREASAIIDRWAERSRQERPETRSTHHEQLRDALPAFLAALGKSLSTTGAPPDAPAREHGVQRWQLGWHLTDVVSDFQLLRVVLLEYLRERLGREPVPREILAIGWFLDDAIRSAVDAFVQYRDEQLDQAEARLNEFLGILGHELRNPLSAVAMGLDVMSNHDDGEERRQAEEVMRREVALLSRLMNDLLDISRISRGAIELRKERIDLRSVIDQAVQASRSSLAARDHCLTVTLAPARLPVEGDPIRLEQVVTNLLSNAAKYTEPGGTIHLVSEQAEGSAVVRVRDNGQGIDPSFLPHVFDLFRQAQHDMGTGLGIGLALVRLLVELHGGRVEASSAGAGLGSEFVIQIPLCGEEPRADAPGIHAAPTAVRPCRILVVDDHVEMGRMFALLLTQCGHQTELATDGEEALRVAAAFRPHVILLDLGLPKLNGYEVASRLRALPEFSDVLLIATTGYAQQGHRDRGSDAGFDHHLVKPIEVDMVHRIIAERYAG